MEYNKGDLNIQDESEKSGTILSKDKMKKIVHSRRLSKRKVPRLSM